MLPSVVLATVLSAWSVLAAKCDLNNNCPKDTPCCSQYGECGIGAFCLGGCDPRSSFSLDSCVPAPVCESRTTKFDSLDKVVPDSKYLGDATKAEWVYQGNPVQQGDNVYLTMAKNSVGTVLASTAYMWYGRVKARFRTSRGRGVVTAFILLSDVKDEIDYEFVGVDLETAQTNFYFQGIPNYHNSGNITVTDSFHDFHDYEINWTPDKIEWLVDGTVGRTVNRKDTWNKTSNQWEFPQTPARVQLSIWPGGLASNAKGTIDWAGGEIDWDSSDIQNAPHYYFTTFSEVTIDCFDAKSPPGTNSGTSYTYNSKAGTNDTVVDGDKKTVLASLQGTGLDMNKGATSKPKDGGASSIPGGISTGQDHGDGSDSSSDSGSGDSGSSGGGSSTPPASPDQCKSGNFHQSCDGSSDASSSGSGSGSGNGGKSGSSKASASALAIIIAGCALFWL